jgi:GDP-L-fucose synthase
MPTNLFGPGDNYDLNNSHVLPALLRRFHEAKVRGDDSVVVWGSGNPRREFLYSDDMADACLLLMSMPDSLFSNLLGVDKPATNRFSPPIINIGMGEDIAIKDLAVLIKDVVGFKGAIRFDTTKPDGTPRKLLDIDRLKKLGWVASIPLREGLIKTYSAFRELSL